MHRTKGYYIALILYLCFVAWIVLLSRERLAEPIIKLHSETIQYIFGNYNDWQSDVTAVHPGALIAGDILNIILFVPIGIFLEAILIAKKRRNSLLRCIIWGFICSLAIEVMQLITQRGWFDVDDLLMNVLGTILGGIFYLVMKRISRIIDMKPEE